MTESPDPLGPTTLAVEVTRRCNCRCLYCYNVWKGAGTYPEDTELSSDDLLSLIKGVLAQSGIRHIQVTGGEPLLRPDLLLLIEGLRLLRVQVSLVTDGALIDKEMAAELLRLGVRPVQPTILAADREVHNRLKGVNNFDATVDGVARLLRLGVPVSVAFVCTQDNASHFRSVVELCFALGVRVIAFNRFCPTGEGRTNMAQLQPSGAMLSQCLDVAQWAISRLGMDISVAISMPLCVADLQRFPHLKLGRCALGTNSPGFTVDPAGRLRACSISSTVLGDLRQESWSTVLQRARHSYFKKMAQTPSECVGCKLLARCGGGCRESAIACSSGETPPDPLALAT